MQSSDTELDSQVRTCLASALPGASIDVVEVEGIQHPLLILKDGPVLAGFAFGSDENTYAAAYSAFKEQYKSAKASWQGSDISFIYCVSPDANLPDAFSSRVETDVFFCRKFVIPLGAGIASALLRLPFFPLLPLANTSARPPSAQTLLQRAGVPAELARDLVVPGRKGARNILTECLARKHGQPHSLEQSSSVTRAAADRSSSPALLESLTIKNFRAYRKPRTFRLGECVTVLYGPNGFGKTSFFDALDFAVTGGVGRLQLSEQAFLKAAKHLDSEGEPTVVSLTLRHEQKSHQVTRSLSNHTQAELDGTPSVSRKDVLALITGGTQAPADRVDNLITLFRATHLFSQEDQELTRRFEERCELPADLVSRMLAFDDYVSGIAKTEEVQRGIKSDIAALDATLQKSQEVIDRDGAELARLESIVESTDHNVASIRASITKLREELSVQQISLEPEVIDDVAETKSLRASLEVGIAAAMSRAEKLVPARLDIQQYRQLSDERMAAEKSAAEHEAQLTGLRDELVSLQAAYREAADASAALKTVQARAQQTRDRLEWLRAEKPEFDRVGQERQEVDSELKKLLVQDEKFRSEETDRRVDVERLNAKITSLSEQMIAVSERGLSLSALSLSQERARGASPRLVALQPQLQEVAASIVATRSDSEKADAEVTRLHAKCAAIESAIAASEAKESEVKSLLASLRGHVHGSLCLLCGVDHGSVESLLARIDAQLGSQTALSAQRTELVQTREALARARQAKETHTEAARTLEETRGALVSERSSLQASVDEFASAAAALGLPPEGAKIDEALDAQRTQVQRLASELSEAKAAAEAAAAAHVAAKSAVESSSAVVQATRARVQRLGDSCNAMLAEAQRKQVDFQLGASEIAEKLAEADKELAAAKQGSADGQRGVDSRKLAVDQKSQHVSSLEKALTIARESASQLGKHASELAASLGEIGLSAESTVSDVQKLTEETVALQARLEGFKERSIHLEMAIDQVRTSAALQSLKDSVRDAQSRANVAKSERASLEKWLKHFENVAKLLGSERSRATDSFTREYGPRTAVIQRRLRSVYGFGDIQVTSRGGAISVGVARRGEALRPTDYFSQSQVQTLLLGLFLTAASSQTWSAFSTTLMDDPVTHFDDLNTYALLDLISGLLNSSDGPRQFVISTCDEKLLMLARQKFRHLQERAVFYRFSEIGAEGPLVSEMPPL